MRLAYRGHPSRARGATVIGTPPYTPPRTVIVNCRVTPEEKRAIEARAQSEQRTVSDWLRLLALAQAWGTSG